MPKIVTYNNLVDLFSAYTANNFVVKRYGNGSLKDLESMISEERSFPLMWSNLVQIDYPVNEGGKINTKNYVFNILFMDILDNVKSNEQEIWSDSIQLAEDFLKYMNWNQEFDFQILNQPQIIPFTERFGEYLSGCNLKLSIQIDADLLNDCSTPSPNFTTNFINR